MSLIRIDYENARALSRLAHTIRKAAAEFEAAEARTKASMSASGGTGSGGGGEW